MILGLDGIAELGGVSLFGGVVRFGSAVGVQSAAVVPGACVQCCGAADGGGGAEKSLPRVRDVAEDSLAVADDDFDAVFDGVKWTVRWKWKGEVPELTNTCGVYGMRDCDKEAYDVEVQSWIDDGLLVPYDPVEHGPVAGIIPMMAVPQPNKAKVRPVMDYRELNQYVKSRPGMEAAVCGDKLREWRKLGEDVCLLDLRKAYLQLHVGEELLRFQAVRHNGVVYVMTRMGFGLNSAPKIMSAVLQKVLSLDGRVRAGTDSYIDDIIVDESVVSASEVRAHLEVYGLLTKDPVQLDGARVLGLLVSKDRSGQYNWRRDNPLPGCDDAERMTKRELFSVCGKLIGHYPVGGWLRVACAYMKRLASDSGWNENVTADISCMLHELLARVGTDDSVRGRWTVAKTSVGKVWCDASSLALGVCVEINGNVVEDGAWLRRKDDNAHINVAELEAVLKGLNLAIKWGLVAIDILTDSATVFGWVTSAVNNTHRPRVSGMSEMVVRRRLFVLVELVKEYGLTVNVVKVASSQNRADVLTRVPKKWLVATRGAWQTIACAAEPSPMSPEPAGGSAGLRDAVLGIHNLHHLGVERTLFFAEKKLGTRVSRAVVSQVVKDCQRCQSIDPASVRWEKGSLAVDETWFRLAADLVHMGRYCYLSVVDCGPGRFAVWRKVTSESAVAVAAQMQHIFGERGPPVQLLTDNGPCFRGSDFEEAMVKWDVSHIFSCAYRPAGNGIVERNHRTIKRMAARTGDSVENALVYYNNSPTECGIIPAQSVYNYEVRVPGVTPASIIEPRSVDGNPYVVGMEVFVKPASSVRCVDQWPRGVVTSVTSDVSVEVDGMPRHISDIRLAAGESREEGELGVGVVRAPALVVTAPDHPARQRHPPSWLADYV